MRTSCLPMTMSLQSSYPLHVFVGIKQDLTFMPLTATVVVKPAMAALRKHIPSVSKQAPNC